MTTKDNPDDAAKDLATDWRDLEVELGWFGTQLDEMRAQPERIGQDVLSDLEQRYEDISRQVVVLKDKTADRLQELSDDGAGTGEAGSTLQDGLESAKEKAGELGQQVAGAAGAAGEAIKSKAAELEEQSRPYRENASESATEAGERVKQAAKDVGHGFGIAWEALKRDFSNAYKRLSDTDGDDDKPKG
ncbi:MAG: hypothetical protein K0U74_17390 [Alphaproteobacteria bacterium]|nr:hypothetical protein [Alphaproteobacteria bacterium]